MEAAIAFVEGGSVPIGHSRSLRVRSAVIRAFVMDQTVETSGLVLSRKKGEIVDLAGGLVQVMVVDIRGDKVRLMFDPPAAIPIHRREVSLEIARNAQAANQTITVNGVLVAQFAIRVSAVDAAASVP